MNEPRLPEEERHRLEAQILHSLWQEGASSLNALRSRLGILNSVLDECLDELVMRRWVYRLWESPQDTQATVFYLTERTRKIFRAAIGASSRYRMKLLWESLKREEGGLPKITTNS